MAEERRVNAWWFVPTLYVLEGLPYFLVNEVSVVLFKRFGMANDAIGWWTSLLAWPWTLKMLWSPLVEVNGTRRHWLLGAEGLLFATMVGFAVTVAQPAWFVPTLAVLTVMAFASATHDVAVDGYYLLALDKTQQAFFTGIRSTAYRLARIVAAGFVVWLAGTLERTNPTPRAWAMALGAAALIQLALWAWNLGFVRPVASDRPGATADLRGLLAAFVAFFRQPGIGWILAFILTYRFPEQMLVKMSAPFLLDERLVGGLAVTTDQVGIVQGTIGVLCLVAGGLAGGFAIARWGLRRCLWPMVVAMHAPNLLYLWAALQQPGLYGTSAVVAVEQLGYGFGFAAYTVFLLRAAGRTETPTSAYAVATGIMAFGAFLAGSLSGFLQVRLGYPAFFATVCVLAIPAVVPLFFVDRDRE